MDDKTELVQALRCWEKQEGCKNKDCRFWDPDDTCIEKICANAAEELEKSERVEAYGMFYKFKIETARKKEKLRKQIVDTLVENGVLSIEKYEGPFGRKYSWGIKAAKIKRE